MSIPVVSLMMRNSIRLLLLMVACLGFSCLLQAEIRAIWILPWSTNTPQKIDKIIADAVSARQTDVMLEVRYRSDALYQTNRTPDPYPNPEPPSYILNGLDFDPLAYALEEAHKKNLRLHAWIVVFNATPTDSLRIRQNYIYTQQPDWITYDSKNKRQQSSSQFGYFIDPGIPQVQDYLLNVIGDIVCGYPELDGVHLDYIRYPEADLGYHPISVQRYREELADSSMSFNQWRQLQVTSFVQRTRALLDTLAPNIILSAAVMADYANAINLYAQDWLDWLQRGYIDYAFPMAYSLDRGEFDRQLRQMEAMRMNDRIVIGLRAWNNGNKSLLPNKNGPSYSITELAARIETVRSKGFGGISLFSYDGLSIDRALDVLADMAYTGQTVARLDNKLLRSTDAELDSTGEDVRVLDVNRGYRLYPKVRESGVWTLEIRDASHNVIYTRDSFYLQGVNSDRWDGILSNGELIAPGLYAASLHRGQDRFEILTPVTIEELSN
ncbi:MAG TPA: family 10 glycosylhydrolase [Candidatus Cloacimonadota bacterium]|nr:family 10 glycosylhydrolase [Candidatus Cloacimonadota bacterium]